MKALSLTLPTATVSEANRREHWRARWKRAKAQRAAAYFTVKAALPAQARPPYRVSLTRRGPRKLDGDNLQSALKAIRDGVADALDVNDGDSKAVRFTYRQTAGRPGIKIKVTWRPER